MYNDNQNLYDYYNQVSPGIIIGCTAVAVTMIVIAAIIGWVVKNKRNKSVTIVSLVSIFLY